MTRLGVQKTLKLYVGGKFIRSESGRVLPTTSARGARMYVSSASRKDTRDTVRTARAAQPGWEGRSAFNRVQILYRLAEMLEDRLQVLPTTPADAVAAVDRAVHHAGWADKIGAVLATINPVAAAYVNYSMVRAMGVVAAVPSPDDGLLGMVEALCAVTVMGNACILIVPPERAELATALAEALATSDLPGGVVNVLTGPVGEVLEWVDKHDDVDGIYLADGVLDADRLTTTELAAARVMRRLVRVRGAAEPAGPATLGRLAEVKTVWMSSANVAGAGAAY